MVHTVMPERTSDHTATAPRAQAQHAEGARALDRRHASCATPPYTPNARGHGEPQALLMRRLLGQPAQRHDLGVRRQTTPLDDHRAVFGARMGGVNDEVCRHFVIHGGQDAGDEARLNRGPGRGWGHLPRPPRPEQRHAPQVAPIAAPGPQGQARLR